MPRDQEHSSPVRRSGLPLRTTQRMSWVHALVMCISFSVPCAATSIVLVGPVLLPQSGGFVASDADRSLTLHRMDDGARIRTYACEERIAKFVASADEKSLAIAGADGGLGVWDIATGAQLWWQPAVGRHVDYLFDLSFSGDGRALVACRDSGVVAVVETQTGDRIGGVIASAATKSNALSAALAPDGTRGAFLNASMHVVVFDVLSGSSHDTGVTGGGVLRYSSDGAYLATPSFGTHAHSLRVLRAHDLAVMELGQFDALRSIEPTSDGRFIATCGEVDAAAGASIVGVMFDPKSATLSELWRLPFGSIEPNVDFDPSRMLGGFTTPQGDTRLVDLSTGRPLVIIERGSGTSAPPIGQSPESDFMKRGHWLVLGVVVLVGAACSVLGTLMWQRRESTRRR